MTHRRSIMMIVILMFPTCVYAADNWQRFAIEGMTFLTPVNLTERNIVATNNLNNEQRAMLRNADYKNYAYVSDNYMLSLTYMPGKSTKDFFNLSYRNAINGYISTWATRFESPKYSEITKKYIKVDDKDGLFFIITFTGGRLKHYKYEVAGIMLKDSNNAWQISSIYPFNSSGREKFNKIVNSISFD